MSNLLKSKFLLGVLIVVAMFAVVGLGQPSQAAADCSITSTLREGSAGVEVQCLQSIVGATADGKFGPMTKAAVMAWQASHGLVADGVVGPLSRSAMTGGVSGNFPAGCSSNSGFSITTGLSCSGASNLPAGCSSTTGYSSTTGAKCDGSGGGAAAAGPLAGTDGTISTMTQLSQYSSEEVGSGQEDVKVLGFEIEGSSDGDIQLNSIKVRFDSNGNAAGDSDRIADYLSSVSVWQGSTKIGSADAADFTKVSTGLYTKVITLSGSIVRADVTEKFYVSVDAVGNLDSGDIDSDSWTIAVDSIRYVDGGGVTTTETAAIPANIDWDVAGDGVAISFVTFSNAADTELKIATVNGSPDTAIVEVETASDTNDVVLLKGKFELEGTSDVLLDEVPITFTATGAANPEAISSSVTLKIGTQEFTESMTTGASPKTITFDNLDLSIVAGSTVNFTVLADVNDLETTGVAATDFEAGDSLVASLTTTNRASMVVENDQGDALTDGSELTGSASGEAQYFYAVAPQIAKVSVGITKVAGENAGAEATDDTADATLVFTVKAVGGTIYVNGDNETTDEKEGIIVVDSQGNDLDVLGDYSYVVASTTGTIDTTNGAADNEYFTIEENEVATFTVSIHLDPAADGFYGVNMTGLQWGTVVTDENTRSANNYNFGVVADELETVSVNLDDGA